MWIDLGFWRNVGYFWSGVMIVGGIILFPLGIVSIMLGLFFIWLLKKSARDERMEKHLKNMDELMHSEKREPDLARQLADYEHDYKQKKRLF